MEAHLEVSHWKSFWEYLHGGPLGSISLEALLGVSSRKPTWTYLYGIFFTETIKHVLGRNWKKLENFTENTEENRNFVKTRNLF